MTEVTRRPAPGLLLASPAATALLAVTTTWALHHRPEPTAPPAPRPAAASTATTVRLRSDLAAAAADLQRTQTSALRLESAVRGRADRLRLLAARVRSIGDGGPVRAAPAGGDAPRPRGAVPPPAPVPVPAAPPVSTSTGAS